jgi:phenylacetate-CoA ligase
MMVRKTKTYNQIIYNNFFGNWLIIMMHKKNDNICGNILEMMPHNKLISDLDTKLLKFQLYKVIKNSSFYREKFTKNDIAKYNSEDLKYFHMLPFTEKSEIINEQKRFPPFGRLLVKNQDIKRIHKTSGTTGRPLYIALTAKDIKANTESGRRAFTCAGLIPDDRVIHCLNYCMWAGGLTDHLSLEATGASAIPFGVGNTKQLIEAIRELKPNSISCTPSYMSRLEVVLKEEYNLEPTDLNLEKGFFGGESGLQNPQVRKKIEDTWNIKAIDANYGMADVLSIFGSECSSRNGLHFHGQGIVHLELIDPKTEESLPVETGVTGEMVLTNLIRQAQPLIRYRTRDIITILGTDTCSCGRQSLRFKVEDRLDDMIVVRGINVYASAVASLLSEYSDFVSGEFEIILNNPPPYERPLLIVEIAKSCKLNMDALKNILVSKCHEKLNFTPDIDLICWGKFPRNDNKTKRIRKTY